VDGLKLSDKSFDISTWEVWEAWEKVKENKGAAGVDNCSVEEFETDLKNTLYMIWNRMSSGSYFPPPVLAVEIPKSQGAGTRGARGCGSGRSDGGSAEAGKEGRTGSRRDLWEPGAETPPATRP
jgi:hypothetical protein